MTYNAFSGLRVVDCASWIAAPAAATILADLGADVIKVEPPKTGDPYRHVANQPGTPQSEHNYAWILGSRNKRSLAVDLSASAGQGLIKTIVSRADVFITNYPRSVRTRLQIDYESLAPTNHRLIYASFTGYGEEGEERDSLGFDSTAWWARSGLMDQMRIDPESAPPRPLYGMGDQPSGLTLFAAIVSALYQRERTGRGDYVSSSLIENGAWSNAYLIQAALCGASIDRGRAREGSPSPLGTHYRCRDGGWILIALSSPDRQWPVLMKSVLQREELLSDPRFVTQPLRQRNARALMLILEDIFMERDMRDWKRRLDEARIPCGFVQRVDEVPKDPQMIESGAIAPIQRGRLMTVSSPFQLRSLEKRAPTMPPGLGQHTNEILLEYGIDQDLIDRLMEDGVVG